MKFLFLSTLLLTFVFFSWSYVLDPFTTLHFSADNQLDAGEFYQAKIDCESILNLQPCLFRQSANSKIGETHIRAAQDALRKPHPDFKEALAWLSGLTNRDQTSLTGSEDLAGQMIQQLPKAHLAFARDVLFYEQKDYLEAAQEFAQITKLYNGWPEILSEARFLRSVSLVELAKAKLLAGHLEESIIHFTDLLKSPDVPPLVIEQQILKIPNVVEEAVRARMTEGRYVSAFHILAYVRDNLPHPVVVEKLTRMREKLEREVFAAQTLGEAPGSVPVPVMTGNAAPRAQKVVVALKNEHAFPVTVFYRGLSRREASLKAGEEKMLELLPGEYLVGAFFPQKATSEPLRGEFILEAGEYRQVFGL